MGYSYWWMMATSYQEKLFVDAAVQNEVMEHCQPVSQHQMIHPGTNFLPPIFSVPAS